MGEASAFSQATAPLEVTAETGPHSIRVLIADDHPIVREGLRRLLSLEDDVEIVGEAATAKPRSPWWRSSTLTWSCWICACQAWMDSGLFSECRSWARRPASSS